MRVFSVLIVLALLLISCSNGKDEKVQQDSSSYFRKYLIAIEDDFALVTNPDSDYVYVVKQTNGKFFKRPLINDEILDLYDFDRDKVRTLQEESLSALSTSPIVMSQDLNLYYLYNTKGADSGVKQFISLTIDELEECGFDIDVIFYVLNKELDERFYSTMDSVADECDDLP